MGVGVAGGWVGVGVGIFGVGSEGATVAGLVVELPTGPPSAGLASKQAAFRAPATTQTHSSEN